MNTRIRNYQFMIRMVGITVIPPMIYLSDYHQNLLILVILVSLYLGLALIIRFKHFSMQAMNRVHITMLFLDVLILSAGIITRGGLRSDFYLGYFLIFAYAMTIRRTMLMTKLSLWVAFCYSGVVYITSPDGHFDLRRLIIRLTLLIFIAFAFQRFVDELINAEHSKENAMEMAFTDPLTSAHNRRMISFLSEDDDTLCHSHVALLDIDDFKKINDVYGHDAGDEVIKTLVNDIYANLDNNHLCIRYGGEEFLLVFDGLSTDQAVRIIEDIRYDFANHHYKWFTEKRPLTFTAGIATQIEGTSIEDSITTADKRLYTGKASGKNCTITS